MSRSVRSALTTGTAADWPLNTYLHRHYPDERLISDVNATRITMGTCFYFLFFIIYFICLERLVTKYSSVFKMG